MKYLLFITAFFLCACSNMQTIKVNDAQPAKVELNKKFRVNLPEDHNTGYTWQLNEHDQTMIDHYNTVWEGNSNGVYFYFVALKPGLTSLNFTSRKYNDVNSIKEITIKVE
jgi:predicted secreted protein